MKKLLLSISVLLIVLSLFKMALAQDTEPPLGLPALDEDSATVTALESVTATVTRTASATTQEAVDDAEVGSEIIALVILSVVGGVGIFLIKRYFDLKSYNL